MDKSKFSLMVPAMTISVADLAKKLEIAPEAVILHAMDLDFEVPDDEMIPEEVAREIEKIEQGDELAQVEHELEDQLEREIVQKQQERTAGNKRVPHKKKHKDDEDKSEKEPEKPQKTHDAEGRIILDEYVMVREFAQKIGKPLPIVLIKLKMNGVVANPRMEIDYETAAVVAEDLGVPVTREAGELSGEDLFRGNLKEMLANEEPENLQERPPVVSIMGHVDHGKTSILDYIRKAKVAEGEAGGITQRIGAYQVQTDNGAITFLDTPGHEAFTVMRARGARATDIAILVVAATEGLMPQSIEAINHAKEAEIPIIVAMNKMDLDGANTEQLKGALAEHEITPEDWGGDVPCIPVSAKTGLGIDALLDAVHTIAAVQELKANPNRPAIGTIIESTQDPKSGVSATVLVNTGTLKKSDSFVIYDQNGRIRTMLDFHGKDLKEAPPSTPVQISGLKELPRVGDLLQVMKSDKEARKRAEEVASISHEDELSRRKNISLAALKARLREGQMSQLKVIVKAESQGTLEAVVAEVEKAKAISSFAKVVHSGVGDVTESDVMLASAGEAIIVAFAVGASGRIEKAADREGVRILSFDVIYHLAEKIQEIVEGRAVQEDEEEVIGTFTVKAVFAATKKMAVIGGAVTSGKVRVKAKFRIMRMQENEEGEKARTEVALAQIESVQQGQKTVNEMNEGTECGLRVNHDGFTFEEGDELELFVMRK